jgi:hypothetical protein
VNTPVGPVALSLYSDKPGNWVHFPGLSTALVGKPKGVVRTFGISIWLLFQTKKGKKYNEFLTKNTNAIMRFGYQDFRLMTYKSVDRFYTEDVGNGLGGGHGYKLLWENRDDAASRWFNIVITGNGEAKTFKMFINGKVVEYAHKDGKKNTSPGQRVEVFKLIIKKTPCKMA